MGWQRMPMVAARPVEEWLHPVVLHRRTRLVPWATVAHLILVVEVGEVTTEEEGDAAQVVLVDPAIATQPYARVLLTR